MGRHVLENQKHLPLSTSPNNKEEVEPQKRGAKTQPSDGTKSLDRGLLKSNGLLNKFSQMARSPQILQRKQEEILKLQQNSTVSEAETLNQDLFPLYIVENEVPPQSRKQPGKMKQAAEAYAAKSPYNNSKNEYNQ